MYEVRFDENTGDKKPTPKLPKSWRLLAISNGSAVNANHLWFQDKEGNIYVVSGFADRGGFILDQHIGKISLE